MNYLAHTLLSKRHIDYQVGNLLADTLKGRPWSGCSQYHREGLAMHKAIDQYTDSNPHVVHAKKHLGSGYLRGIVLDITFDHYISKHWESFVAVSFESFVARFYQQAEQCLPELPNVGATFIQRLIRYDFFHLYTDFSSLAHVLKKFDERLSEKVLAKESASDYLPVLQAHYSAIEKDFLLFFPELIDFFITNSKVQTGEHYFGHDDKA